MQSLIKFAQKFKRYFSIIIYYPIAFIFKILKIYVPHFIVERIGHLASDPDSFLKEYYLQNQQFPFCILLAPSNFTANKKVAEYWGKYFLVIHSPIICRILAPLCFHPLLKSNEKYSAIIGSTSSIYAINSKWVDKEPLLKINNEDLKIGKSTLIELGLNEGDWFVCFHARDGGYSPSDEHLHSFRNVPLEDYLQAIKFIISKGGKCIRMGDSSMPPAPKLDGLIDYALSPFKSEAMDIFLCSECLFFCGSNSGLYELAYVFGSHSVIPNMAPMSLMPKGSNDIGIPMLYTHADSGELIDFKSVMQTSKSNFRSTKEFKDAGIELHRNKPSEILELVKEQYLRTKNIYSSKDTNQVLQKKYKSLFKDGHYSFGYTSKIGEDFLQRYSKLLP